ncbi:hypothetical protein OCEANICA350_12771 [Oceanicaulis sp. 350]|nr:hypothetical protein OCEANICA350_12771 [Oceanicaulis sp. 350]
MSHPFAQKTQNQCTPQCTHTFVIKYTCYIKWQIYVRRWITRNAERCRSATQLSNTEDGFRKSNS